MKIVKIVMDLKIQIVINVRNREYFGMVNVIYAMKIMVHLIYLNNNVLIDVEMGKDLINKMYKDCIIIIIVMMVI